VAGEAPPLGTNLAIQHYREALLPLLVVLVVGAWCAIALRDRPPSPAFVESLPDQTS